MMALPPQASNQKLAPPPPSSSKLAVAKTLLWILFAGTIGAAPTASTGEEPFGSEEHEREEFDVNSYVGPYRADFSAARPAQTAAL
jgi:hypothetical protein